MSNIMQAAHDAIHGYMLFNPRARQDILLWELAPPGFVHIPSHEKVFVRSLPLTLDFALFEMADGEIDLLVKGQIGTLYFKYVGPANDAYSDYHRAMSVIGTR